MTTPTTSISIHRSSLSHLSSLTSHLSPLTFSPSHLSPLFSSHVLSSLFSLSQLSNRDKEILNGIGPRTHRMYPVRKGEKIESILRTRKISMDEARKLNPTVNLSKLGEGQVLKLPAGKYTLREREMMQGTAGAPDAFFTTTSPLMLAGLLGAGAGAGAAYWYLSRFGDPLDSDQDDGPVTL